MIGYNIYQYKLRRVTLSVGNGLIKLPEIGEFEETETTGSRNPNFLRRFSQDTVIPRLTKIVLSGITFVSRNVMLSGVSLLAVSNANNPVGLVGLPYVMWSAHFFVTHIQTEKISSWNGPTVHICCFILARTSTKTFVSRIHIR